jgi:hypothetical protein
MYSKFKILLILALVIGACSKKAEEEPTPSSTTTTSTSTTGTVYSNDFCGKYKMTAKDSAQSTNGADAPTNPEFKDILTTPDQHSFVVLFTGLWCSPCGMYAVRPMDSLANLGLKNIHFISAQINDSLSANDELNGYFSSMYGITSYPGFSDAGGLYHQSPLWQNALSFAKYRRDNIIPKAGVGLKAKICGTDILVKAKVKMYADYPDSLKIQLLLVEDNIYANQAYYPNAKIMKHTRVIRTSVIPGSLLAGTNVMLKELPAKSGEEFHFKYKYAIKNIPGINTKNLRVLAIVWNSTNFVLTEFVNCNEAVVE